MENSSLSRLPVELLHLLAENADSSTRASIAQTCRTLHALVTPYLYKRAEIKEGKYSQFSRAIDTNAHLVRHVTVDNRNPFLPPCQIALRLDKLENLERLQLTGNYWGVGDEDTYQHTGEKWDRLEGLLENYFERASLKQPQESRIAPNLRSLTLDHTALRNTFSAFFHYPEVFMIPQLQELTLAGFRLQEYVCKVPNQHERQTELKSLCLDRCWVGFPALESALRAPRALEYLSIGHTEYYKTHDYGDANDNNATLSQFTESLLLHKDSLKGIKIIHEEIYGDVREEKYAVVREHEAPSVNDPSFQEYAMQFSQLKRWEGCDRRSLAMFLQGRSSFEIADASHE